MTEKMLISVITVVFNGVDTIADCIKSVQSQTYPYIEHIIIDGGSTDGTLEVVERYSNKIAKLISEPDRGMYDAINKGLKFAGGDVIAILNSDDFYASDRVLEKVADVIKFKNLNSCYGDIVYVDRNNTNKVVRYWKAGEYRDGIMRYGWHPPHPAFFVKKKIYDKYGYFNTNFKIASDYELMLRLLEKHKISTYYLPEVLVKMRIGGKSNSSLKNIIYQTLEDYRAWKVNGLYGGFFSVLLKKLRKAPQFLQSP
ncbi:MAG: glycosyltransferase family 2 protein [Thermoplasmata archaeon]